MRKRTFIEWLHAIRRIKKDVETWRELMLSYKQ